MFSQNYSKSRLLPLVLAVGFYVLIAVLTVGQVQPAHAKADTLFEGYYRILLADKPIGFHVVRYGFDQKKKRFTSTYLLVTNLKGGSVMESLNAVANEKFQPISYQYTTKVNNSVKMIDAKFSKGKMSATISDGKKANNITRKLPKGTFLSTFLGYLMLHNGYSIGKKFSYKAIAEEDGEIFSGQAFIKEEKPLKGLNSFRILNTFKNSKFISLVTDKGEVLGTTSPLQNVTTELVATPAEATKGFKVPAKSLKLLFGNVPTGKINSLAQLAAAPAVTPAAAPAAKPMSSDKKTKGTKSSK